MKKANYKRKSAASALSIENFILEEFKYSSTYTQQMLKDRQNMINLYVTYFAVTAAILGFFFKYDNQSFEELTRTINPYLPYLLFLFGLIHTYFFVRLGYLDKKYNSYLHRMNNIRMFYIKNFNQYYPDIDLILTPIIMPRIRGIVYPLFPATVTYAVIAVILFGSMPFMFPVNWIMGIGISLITVIISLFVFYKIAKADTTR